MPLRLRELLQHILNLWAERWRSHRSGQNPKADAFRRAKICAQIGDGIDKRAPTADAAFADDRLRAIWIVKAQHRGLRENIGCAKARWMSRIAFDLGGPAHVAFYNNPVAMPPSVIEVA